jgi:HTH-type transcriptional regulator/antitoxin HigA
MTQAQIMVPVIRSDADHAAALARIETIVAGNDDRLDEDDGELEALTLLVESYEAKRFPVEDPDPIEMLEFRMAQLGLNTSRLAETLGIGRGRASELLHRKRRLSLDLIRTIVERLHIAPSLLIPPYETERSERSRDGSVDG